MQVNLPSEPWKPMKPAFFPEENQFWGIPFELARSGRLDSGSTFAQS